MKKLLTALMIGASATGARADVKPAFAFTDNMVLQRGIAVPVWGTATPGERVTVAFAGQQKATIANEAGQWALKLDPLVASSDPAELTVSGKDRVVLKNVVVGEVWICSGQSNMELKVEVCDHAQKEIAEAGHPLIRLFATPQIPANEPLRSIHGARWVECSPATIAKFSALGYYFGRELQRKLGVPIGLINSSWGGTRAEWWMSDEALNKIPAMASAQAQREAKIAHSMSHSQEPLYSLAPEVTADVKNGGLPLGWADLPDPQGDWREMILPAQWQKRGPDFSGVLWFRKTLDIPAQWAGRELMLSVGAVDKSETTYFNNVKVGSFGMDTNPHAWLMNREYAVPAELSKHGRAVVTVRVYSEVYDGGMTGPADKMKLTCPSLPESPAISLAGTWKYAVECNYGLRACLASTLFNGMISPWTRFALRGAIWYQGESNADAPELYQQIICGMIQDWRAHWNLGDFPFLIVQLSNINNLGGKGPALYGDTDTWPVVREAQRSALRLPNTGLVTHIDLNPAGALHPGNKQDLGARLALNALHNVYGQKEVEGSGPVLESTTREGAAIRLHFSHLGGGLVAKGGEPLKGFVICGAHQKFVPAEATIHGADILVSSPSVAEPLAVRYGWADNPECNLFNQAGLPASPFRTDDFPFSRQQSK